MHINKIKVLGLVNDGSINRMSLNEAADIIGTPKKPHIVKFHLSSLVYAGLVFLNNNGDFEINEDGKQLCDFVNNNKPLFSKIERLYQRKSKSN